MKEYLMQIIADTLANSGSSDSVIDHSDDEFLYIDTDEQRVFVISVKKAIIEVSAS